MTTPTLSILFTRLSLLLLLAPLSHAQSLISESQASKLEGLRPGVYVQVIANSELTPLRYLEGVVHTVTRDSDAKIRDVYLDIGRDVALFVAVNHADVHMYQILEGPTQTGRKLLTRDLPLAQYLRKKISFRPSKLHALEAARAYLFESQYKQARSQEGIIPSSLSGARSCNKLF